MPEKETKAQEHKPAARKVDTEEVLSKVRAALSVEEGFGPARADLLIAAIQREGVHFTE